MRILPKRSPRSITRLTIDVQQNLSAAVRKIAQEDGISTAHAVRKAVIVYNRLRQETRGHASRRLTLLESNKVVREFLLP